MDILLLLYLDRFCTDSLSIPSMNKTTKIQMQHFRHASTAEMKAKKKNIFKPKQLSSEPSSTHAISVAVIHLDSWVLLSCLYLYIMEQYSSQ